MVLDRIIEEEQGHWFVRDKEVKSSYELVVGEVVIVALAQSWPWLRVCSSRW